MDVGHDTDIKSLPMYKKMNLIRESDGLLIDILEYDRRDDGYIFHHGNLNLRNLRYLTCIPGKFSVYGSLLLTNCVNLKIIPFDIKVEGDLDLRGCGIIHPYDVQVLNSRCRHVYYDIRKDYDGN